MKLQQFPLLADENIHADVIASLRARGCDVVAVRETNLIGSDDLSLMRIAYVQGRVIVTHDSDFGAFAVAQGEPIVGLVFLRPGHIDPNFTLDTLQVIFDRGTDLTTPFILVAQRTGPHVMIRVRQL